MTLRHTLEKPLAPVRVVVIGAEGFVGGAVCRRLERDGIAVLALGRFEANLLADDAADRLTNYLRSDDTVVAVAARAPCRDIDMLVENLAMVRAMLVAIGRVPVAHVVNISSDAVYGDEPLPLIETTPAAPGSLHGAMHLAREIAFRAGVAGSLAILRPTLIYGDADPHNGYGPNRFRRLAVAGQPIVLFGEGEERRDHVHIDDVAEVVARVVLRRSEGTLNVATGSVHSFRAIAEMVVTGVAKPVSIVTSVRNGSMPHRGYRPFDVSALLAAFPGFCPLALPDGLRRDWQVAKEGGHGPG